MKTQWVYYVHLDSGAVAKVNTEELEGMMIMGGFRRCSYGEYLAARKAIREREQEIRIEGQVKDEH